MRHASPSGAENASFGALQSRPQAANKLPNLSGIGKDHRIPRLRAGKSTPHPSEHERDVGSFRPVTESGTRSARPVAGNNSMVTGHPTVQVATRDTTVVT